MSYILGIHTGHTSTASIMLDGKIISCISEERLVRVKEQGGFPRNAITEVLDVAGITPSDVDHVSIAGFLEPVTSFTNRGDNWFRRLYKNSSFVIPKKVFQSSSLTKRAAKAVGRNRHKISSELKSLGILTEDIRYYDHHDCHASTAYNLSGFSESLVLTCDGGGDGLCATIQIGKNGILEKCVEISQYNSIGRFYSAITEYLGMKPLSHEYKVMGLAAYSKPEHVQKVYDKLRKIIVIDPKNPLKFLNVSGVHPSNFLPYFHKLLKYERFDNISSAVQLVTEELLTTWVRNAVKTYGFKHLCLAGGVFMNVKANQKILELDEVDSLFIMPSCGDESVGIGASILHSTDIEIDTNPIKSIYFGREYDEEYYKNTINDLDKNKYSIEYREDINSYTGEKLSDGLIIGRHNGPMEFGARALGNRSILTDPRNLSSVSKINEAIKNRDFWMPFTPSVLNEDINKYINNPKNHFAPYMIMTFDTKTKGKEDLPAAVHQKDHTTRPQMVKKDWNSGYHELISSFKKETGVSASLNTSFNLHGYPIVNSPEDSIYVFNNSDLDALAIGNYFVTKK